MSAELEIAERFRAAVEAAVSTGERSGLLELVAPDVEWVTPLRTLRGVDELATWRVWGSSGEGFDFEFGDGEWVDRGDGRVDCEVHQVYRVKASSSAGSVTDGDIRQSPRAPHSIEASSSAGDVTC